MASSEVPKKSNKFICYTCDYITSRHSQYDRHIMTLKHQNASKCYINASEKVPMDSKITNHQCICGRIYLHDSSYYRHKKKCKVSNNCDNQSINNINIYDASNNIIVELLKQNQEFKTLILELVGKGIQTTTNNTTNNNTTNNKFNLNFFLNEQCKDAMNLIDFVNSLELQLVDLENVGEYGYAKGVSKIIINGLKQLDIFKRPIHCSDIKRDTMYVKDQNAWEKENAKNEKIIKMIKQVAHKNIKQLPEWQEENPEYKDSESIVHEQFLKIVNKSMGGYNEEEDSKNFNKIVKTIAKEVTIDRD